VRRIVVRERERQILPDGAIRPRQHLGDAHYANGRGSAIGQTQRDAPHLALRLVLSAVVVPLRGVITVPRSDARRGPE